MDCSWEDGQQASGQVLWAEKRGYGPGTDLRVIYVGVMALKRGSGWDCLGIDYGKGRVGTFYTR